MAGLLRRLLTIPLYGLLFGVALLSLPLTLPAALAVDLARGSRLAALRSLLFFVHYLACEVVGILCALALAGLGGMRLLSQEQLRAAYFGLQCRWASALLGGAERIFGLHFRVSGDAEAGRGPVIVFARHVSVADTVLPAVFLSARHGLQLRSVMKRELLWDPCLDLVGHRLPNYFVQRGSGSSEREIAGVAALGEGLGADEGVLIFPEGTRFTPAKRARALKRLGRSDPGLAAQAEKLEHVLPPRLGGPLALLESAAGADVVFCAHVGFDRAARFSEFLRGGLIGRRVEVCFWRVPAAAIPQGDAARRGWLLQQWTRVDAWVRAHADLGA